MDDYEIGWRVTLEKPRPLGGIEQSQSREASFVVELPPIEN
ncbi:MAG: hypothetical protein O3A00_17300 [Planctomycetota bacterium]|nr:hypothetical protein [Planctomycetota bacterium]